MAAITSHKITGLLSFHSVVAERADIDDRPIQVGVQVDDLAVNRSSVAVDLLPVSILPSVSIQTHSEHQFVDDFYYRQIVTPSRYDAGDVLADQSIQVSIWNAFFVSKTLASIGTAGADGIEITQPAPAPLSFSALEEKIYTATISNDGPATIDALISFNFPDGPVTLSIVGSRVTVIPFMPQRSHKETLEWSTEIIATRSNEQRIMRRKSPRQKLDYNYILDGSQYATARGLSETFAAGSVGVPIWAEVSEVRNVLVGDTVIPADTSLATYEIDGSAIVWADYQNFAVVKVQSFDGASITIQEPIAKAFTFGYLAPVRVGRPQRGFSFQRTSSEYTRMSSSIRILDNYEISSAAISESYRTRPVYTATRLLVGAASESIERRVKIIDADGGAPPEIVQLDNKFDNSFVLSVHTDSQQEAFDFKQFLQVMAGRLKTMWIHSNNDDLTIAEDVTQAATSITVQQIGYPQYYGVTDIRILLKSGDIFYRRLTSGSSGNASQEVLSMDSSLGQLVTPSDVEKISFMHHVRFDTDKIQLNRDGLNLNAKIPLMGVPE